MITVLFCYSQTDETIKWGDTIKFSKKYISIPMPDGDILSGILVRDSTITTPQPTVLMYSIYAGPADLKRARLAALKGYAGIVVNTRGKDKSLSTVHPFEHDTADAYAMLEWISNQPWCNKKIGMYGGSYVGFSQWAAAKSGHPALKTIIPQASVGPGIDFPMHNNVFMSYALNWLYFVSNTKLLDNKSFNDSKKWREVNIDWYKQGLSYRELDSLYGQKNETFQKWLDNPYYNEYWQKMTPYKNDFANINIPVLTITGYYDSDQLGALNYYKEHHKYNPAANHYLIIGPYNHNGPQGMPEKEFQGYTIDEAARVNYNVIVFKWFDYILKESTKPDFIKDHVNYQVMGGNEWKHASSLVTVSNDNLTFYLSAQKTKKKNRLSTTPLDNNRTIPFEVNFKDRKNGEFRRSNSWLIASKRLYNTNCLQFVSDPLEESLIINGNFTGELIATINKKDMDIVVELYELKANGSYFELSHFLGRASYTKDREKRQLLTPGTPETIPFANTMFTGKKIEKGSRIVVTVGINKDPFWQINYGTGDDVSNESIADADEPLKILWHTDSFVKIPVWRENKNSELK